MTWQLKTLGEVAEIVSGGTPSTSNVSYWDGDFSWITPKDLSGYPFRYISNGERSITEEGLKNSSARLLPKDSVVFTTRAPIGYAAIAKKALATNQGFKSLVLKEGHDPRFFYYLLKNNKSYIEQFASGSTFKEISANAFRKLEFLIPSPAEQKEIADNLSAFDEKIEFNINLHEKIEQFLSQVFMMVMTTPEGPSEHLFRCLGLEATKINLIEKNIDQIADVVGGGTPSTKESSNFCSPSSGIPWITPKDLSGYKWKYISGGEVDISELGLKNSGAKIMPKGTVLFSSRAPIGYVAISSNEVTTNQGFKSLVPNKGYGENFLYYLLKYMTPTIESRASGSTFKEISGGALKEVPIKVPDINVAMKLENFFAAFSLKQNLLHKQNQCLEGMKSSLIDFYFRGGKNASL